MTSAAATPPDVRRGSASPANQVFSGLCPSYGLWPKQGEARTRGRHPAGCSSWKL